MIPEENSVNSDMENQLIQHNAIDQQNSMGTRKDKNSGTPGSIRVSVDLLDKLMTLAGELVLSRNQLIQGISSSNERATEVSSQRIDMITSELQETIMHTRMQPIANVFNKFTRVVRDLSQELGKSIDLVIEGRDVELDKTIIESINDPLTHLIRNAADHGIETAAFRKNKGKNPTGTISLKAFHDAGQVNIAISDDGKGLDPDKIAHTAVKKGIITESQIAGLSPKDKMDLIFKPGFSTAEKVTDVSGRGVGMDVVITNLEKLGGIIEIDSVPGKGTDIQIKLPLTLAIIPSQLITVGKEQFAIPQVNLDELLRIPAGQVKEMVEKVGDAEVVRLRGELLPLLNLSEILGIKRFFSHPDDGIEYQERRIAIADRRSARSSDFGKKPENDSSGTENTFMQRKGGDRRYHSSSALNIAVVSAGSFKYGMIVDELRDSEEIVVKPLGRHLTNCAGYSGATIMGDGRVALILDVSSMAQMAGLSTAAETSSEARESNTEGDSGDKTSLLLFKSGEAEHFAVPLNLVERIERIPATDIELVGGKKVVQYRGGALPLYELSQVVNVAPLAARNQHEAVVFNVGGNEFGLLVTPPVDVTEVYPVIDDSALKQPGILGTMTVEGHTTLFIDIFNFAENI